LTGGCVATYPVYENSIQGDCRFLGVLERMGCRIEWLEDGVQVTGPKELNPIDIDMNAMPDMVPTLAVTAAFAAGRTRIRNVAHLRLKESDRIGVVVSQLAALGVSAQEHEDGLSVEGGGNVHGATVDSHDDHRIAMAFALAGLRVPGVEIHRAEAVAKSFPSFWDEFEQLIYGSH
jgi:3-phosphoshikimate 1-carboxyvinyltransferase